VSEPGAGIDLEAADVRLAEQEAAVSVLRAGRTEARLVAALTSALKVSQLHSLENVAVADSLAELEEALEAFLTRTAKAAILVGEERVYVNGRLVRSGQTGHSWVDEFMDVLARNGLGGIVLSGRWSGDAVRQLVQALKSASGGDRAGRYAQIAAAVPAVLEPAGVAVLDEAEAAEFANEAEEGYLSEAQRAAFYHARLVALAEATRRAVAGGRPPDVYGRNVRQTLIKIVDFADDDALFAARLLAATSLPLLQADPLASHAANVAVLALAMSRLLDLKRGVHADLGFAAFFHDVGRAEVGRGAVGPDGAEDPSTAREHVVAGVRFGLRARSYGSAGLLRLIVAAEHHRPCDGYPDAPLRDPHPFSRVVAIADAFDKLRHGIGRPPHGAARALRALGEDPTRYDPALVALLEDAVGRLPAGTLLRLHDGRVVLVVDGGGRYQHRPVVRSLLLPGGQPDPEGAYAELRDPAQQVAAELDPSQVQLDWRLYVLA